MNDRSSQRTSQRFVARRPRDLEARRRLRRRAWRLPPPPWSRSSPRAPDRHRQAAKEPWGARTTLARRGDHRQAEGRGREPPAVPVVRPVRVHADGGFQEGERRPIPASTTLYPAKLTAAGGWPADHLPVNIRNRGILRRNPRTCGFPPIRIEFPKDEQTADVAEARMFEGRENIKLVTHC